MSPQEFVAEKACTWTDVARAVGLSPSFVSQIITGRRQWPVPASVKFEKFSGGLVSRKELRDDWADIWPDLS